MKNHTPKRPLQFLRWFCREDFIEEIEGDLMEVFINEVEHSPRRAKWKFAWSVIKYLRPEFMKTFRNSNQLDSFGMYKSYFKIGWRNLLKNKAFSFINITGLSIGLACCMLLFLYTKDEVSFDNFHKNKSLLYQLTVNRTEQKGSGKKFAMAAMVQGPAFKQAIPEIDEFVRVRHQQLTVRKEKEIFTEKISWADVNFFSVFSFPLLSGNPKNALADIHSLVLSEQTALKYFGSIDVLGKSLDIDVDGNFETFIVTAIAQDCPQNSSIKFNVVLPFNYLEEVHPDNGWHWVSFPTYFLLNPKADPKDLPAKMQKVYQTQAAQEIDEMKLMGYGDQFIWGVLPFNTMHLNTEFEGTPESSSPIYSYILSGISVLVLIIACINFVNLTVAQSIKRGKEIGIRKVIGGHRHQLVAQFLGESFLVCFIAFLLAILLAQLCLPIFNQLAGKQLNLNYLLDAQLIGGAIALFIITVFTAGFYPALVLSGFNPIKTLYNRGTLGGRNYLAKSLTVVQFSVAAFLIIATLFIYAQFNLLTKMNLGYDDKNVIEVTVEKAIMNKAFSRLLKAEFSGVKGVENVAPKNIGKFGGTTKANDKEFVAVYDRVDEDYLKALRIELVTGRNFSRDFPADSINSVMVNETFIKEAGWFDPIGKTIDFMNIPGWGNKKITIVGVVKDYHFESLKEKIKPQVFTYEPKLPLGKFLIRINPSNIPETLTALENTYRKALPFDPFQYSFVEENNYNNYQGELKWKQIITIASWIAIFITCIGLLGLTALATERRTKEIGIRKTLGASATQIVVLISQDFIKLVIIGFFIAAPIVWFAIDSWLQGFAYRVQMSGWIFALAGVLAMSFALLTIGIQAFTSALSNPVNSLRSE